MATILALFHHYLPCFPRHRQSIPSSPVPPSPLTVYPTPAYILIETLDDANRYLSTIVDGDVVGFDLEWVDLPNRHKLSTRQKKAKLREEILHAATFSIDWTKVQVCLAQIAIPNNPVYIVHIRRIKELPTEFVRICQSPQIRKVSVGLFSDGQQLWDSFRLNLFSVVSLGHAARLAYPEDILPLLPYGNEPGLAPVVERALNFRIPKDLQVSAWDLIPLSEAQQNYAATDSHAALASHAVIQRELAECGFAVNENWYMYDVVNRARVALARGIAKYKSEAHRRSAAEYRLAKRGGTASKSPESEWPRIGQQLKKHDPDRQGRKERALEADAKVSSKTCRESCVGSSVYVAKTLPSAFIEKHGMEAHRARLIREQNASEEKAAAIAKENS
ncbi:ribonuclease H-like domain-containing protein [Mycena galopus ATCC 62051]|nr:ribonuclease H-like domain-containing protein [Mycena galopus ATCC 62051]